MSCVASPQVAEGEFVFLQVFSKPGRGTALSLANVAVNNGL